MDRQRAGHPPWEKTLVKDVGALIALKDYTSESSRKEWMTKIKEVLEDFATLDSKYGRQSPLSEPVEQIEQGLAVDDSPDSSSGTAITAKGDLAKLLGDDRTELDRFLWAVHAVLADPRPSDDADHRDLYDLLHETALAFAGYLKGRYNATVEHGPSDIRFHTAATVMNSFARKAIKLRDAGLQLVNLLAGKNIHEETFRRDTIAEIRDALSLHFDIDASRLMRTTGRDV